jgi:hypothetical protein
MLMRNLESLGKAVHENAVEKGFYDQIRELLVHPELTDRQKDFIRFLWRSNRLMLMVSELAEGLEGLRKNNLSGDPKSGGLLEELADAQIRLADFVYDEWMDLDLAVQDKHEYNLTRPKMHGGKVA